MKFELADKIDKLRIESALLTSEIERLNFENKVLSAAGNALRSKLEALQAQEPLTDDRLIELIEPLIYKEASDLEIARAIQTAVLAARSEP